MLLTKHLANSFAANPYIDWQTHVGQNVIGIIEISIMKIERRKIRKVISWRIGGLKSVTCDQAVLKCERLAVGKWKQKNAWSKVIKSAALKAS